MVNNYRSKNLFPGFYDSKIIIILIYNVYSAF